MRTLETGAAAIDLLASSGRLEEAIEQRAELIGQIRDVGAAGRSLLARCLLKQAAALDRAGRSREALPLLREVVERFSDVPGSTDIALRYQAQWLICRITYEIECYQEAVAAADAIVAEAGSANAPAQLMSAALMTKSRCLSRGRLGRTDLQRAVLDDVLSRCDGVEAPWARFCVADAMFEKAKLLADEGERGEALRLWDTIFDRFSSDPPADTGLPFLAQATKINLLIEADQIDAAREAAWRLNDCLESRQRAGARGRTISSLGAPTRALLRAAIAVERAGQLPEALALFTSLHERLPTDFDPELQELAVGAAQRGSDLGASR